MNKGIAIAGNLIVDTVKNIDKYPEAGLLTNVRSVSKCIGGCAGNTISDLAKIDKNVPLTCIGRVGDDENGKYIVDLLKQFGVDTRSIGISQTTPTSFTDVMFDMESGERTFFHGRGANAEFSLKHIDFAHISADIFHIGYALLLDEFDKPDKEYGTVMAHALAMAQQKGMKTSIDVVSEVGDRYKHVVTPSLKYCDYAIMNEIEAGRVAELEPRDQQGEIVEDNLRRICEKLFELGVSELVVIHMPELGCAMNSSGEFHIVKSYHLPSGFIKGTVGAGDAFCAGMLYALYKEWDIDKSMRFANAAAACCLSCENSVDGMKSVQEVEKMQTELMLRR